MAKKTIIISVLCLLFILIVGGFFAFMQANFSAGPYRKKELKYSFHGHEYKLVIPSENTNFAGYIYFPVEEFTTDELKLAFEENGCIVDKRLNGSNEEILIIGYNTEKGFTRMFVVEKTDDGDYYFADTLFANVDGCGFPFPTYLTDSATFQDYVDFYNSSLTEIVKIDSENQTIVIKAIDVEIDRTLNSSVEICYSTVDGKSNVQTNRVDNIE